MKAGTRPTSFTEKDGAARIHHEPDGEYSTEHWFRDGQQHRDDGPAVVERQADGSRFEEYCRNGKLHREDGPAEIEYGPDGFIGYQSYWRDGTQLEQAPERQNSPDKEQPQPQSALDKIVADAKNRIPEPVGPDKPQERPLTPIERIVADAKRQTQEQQVDLR
ncbi:MAG: hypothetical protein WCA22_05125 [Candidatus Binatus sp.]